MPRPEPSPSLERLESLCRQQGLPLTVQRRLVLQVLARRSDHPTADQVYDEVAGRAREVSRTTVYRILDALIRARVARKVCHPGAAARFEVKMHRHHHLICLECEKVVDLEDASLDSAPLPNVRRRGFVLADYSIQFRGTCSQCARKKREIPCKAKKQSTRN
jgi:Fur family peroxide stress response transcriptional regulator